MPRRTHVLPHEDLASLVRTTRSAIANANAIAININSYDIIGGGSQSSVVVVVVVVLTKIWRR